MERVSKRELRWTIGSLWLLVALAAAGLYGYFNGVPEVPQVSDRVVVGVGAALVAAIVVTLCVRAGFRAIKRRRRAKAHSWRREVIDLRSGSTRAATPTPLAGELASYYHEGLGVWVSDHGERGRWVKDPRTQRWVPIEQFEAAS